MIGNLFIPQDFKEGMCHYSGLDSAMTGVKEQSYSNSTSGEFVFISVIPYIGPR